ncbi:GIY-YIG nuclease family protein [Priestia megaterium]|uniref:GIY-YIG nuclease family protein n=1 Tax=Priestia megaterium TaxID=1404 RepID=UPI003101779C
MSELSMEDFNHLKPKEIRHYFGIQPVARIIKYLQEGTPAHKSDAIRTISYWLRGLDVRTAEDEILTISIALPFLIEQFPLESLQNRISITASFYFLVKTHAILDEKIVELINELATNEEDPFLKKKLMRAISWNDSSKTFISWMKCKAVYINYTKEEVIKKIKDLEAYKSPLQYKPRQHIKVSVDDIQCVYFLQEKDNGYVKIGKTKNLRSKTFFPYLMPFKWEVIHTIESSNINSLEKYFHRLYRHKCINGEWFNLDEQDILDIKTFELRSRKIQSETKKG